MESIWHQTIDLPARPALAEDLTVKAAVIGGGLAGILTAYFLQQRQIETIVLEASHIGSGQTGNTTAKITSQHNMIYNRLRQYFGEEKARQYGEANQQAIQQYRSLIQRETIDCAFQELPAYLYCQSSEQAKSLEAEVEAAKSSGVDAEFTTQTTLPFAVAGAVKFPGQAQFHPLAFLKAIAKDLRIFEQTRVLTVEDDCILTERGKVKAKHIVFATHFPFLNMPGLYFARMHQERSYVLALKDAAQLDGMYLGVEGEALSFRNFGDTLLLGGGSHRTGENTKGGKYALLRAQAKALYPGSSESAHWSAQDCITLDGVPYIGAYAAAEPNWYVATGFGKWGMTSSMVAAGLIADEICGVDNPWAEVFSPLRFTPSASAKSFFMEMGHAVNGLSRQIFAIPEAELADLPQGHGGVIENKGEKVGVFKDEQATVHLVSTRCPHLGCQLAWNPDEKSWDCPCHGSRFDYQGNLLDNPAQTDLERSDDA